MRNYIKNLRTNYRHQKGTSAKIEAIEKLIKQNEQETKEFVDNLFKSPIWYLACVELIFTEIIPIYKVKRKQIPCKAIFIDEKNLSIVFEKMLEIVRITEKKNLHHKLQNYAEINYNGAKLSIYRWRENDK